MKNVFVAYAVNSRSGGNIDSNDNIEGFPQRALPLQIYVDAEVRNHLNMRNSDRKARIYLPANYIGESVGGIESSGSFATASSENKISVKAIRNVVEKRFISLQEQPYVLRYQLPGVMSARKQFLDDNDVLVALRTTLLDSLPCLQLYVETLPGVFPPPEKSYLIGMNDPNESDSFTLLSFYRFFAIDNPEEMALSLETMWKPFRPVGRIYVAKEGVNAQMAVPTNVLINFQKACETEDLLKDLYLNCDHLLSRAEFEVSKPFKALHIRVRDQIVADGFDEPLDWHKSGREMPPLEWHEKISDPRAIILDCRNSYESDVGIFENAIPLNTTFFRESWDALDEVLANAPKDAPIMTYCTGGIRCVKINAYLEQKLGFTNIARLQGGIISYARDLENGKKAVATSTTLDASTAPFLERHVEQSKFKGTNYVFDERMGARITSDILSTCETCGSDSDLFTNCDNFNCHIRFIQCPRCKVKYNGCCCMYCKKDYENALHKEALEGQLEIIAKSKNSNAMIPRKSNNNCGTKHDEGDQPDNVMSKIYKSTQSKVIDANFEEDRVQLEHASMGSMDAQVDALSIYCERHSEQEPELLKDLREETMNVFKSHARMISGHLQGRLLAMLTSLSRSKNVLELGAFTGYSALCFAEGLEPGGKVLSCDIDEVAIAIAHKYIEKSPYGKSVDLRHKKCSQLIQEARDANLTFDLVFIDADKKLYEDYLKDLMGDPLGTTDGPKRCLLVDGALILVDNTLWKGLVLGCYTVNDEGLEVPSDLAMYSPDPALYGKAERMEMLAQTMHSFNTFVSKCPKLYPVMLPLRDGLSAIRFRM